MPVNIPVKLPAVEILKKENIFVMDTGRASSQDIRPLKLVILNLMPLKITTETDLIRLLSNTPIQVEIDFMKMKKHTPKNTPIEHMVTFYKDFDVIKKSKYDGMIVTGAPVETLPFEKVKYWKELTEIFDWAKTNVTSNIFICWGAQAALNYYYGVPKHILKEKLFGVFEHSLNDPFNSLFRGFDDVFFVPHSRNSECRKSDILKVKDLTILSESKEAGVYIVMARKGREIYITGHAEYSSGTLDEEYKRDLKKGLNVKKPVNYYVDNDPAKGPLVRWRSTANLFFSNWINYYLYQNTPYDIKDIH